MFDSITCSWSFPRMAFAWVLCMQAILMVTANQRVPPGVNPQQYHQQQQQQYQQYQQVPQHVPVQQQQFQQVPVQQQQQFQQVPVQQQQQFQQVPVQQQQYQVPQVPQQQVPVQQQQQFHPPTQGHHPANSHHGQPQLLNVANVAHEKEHIAEHLDVPIDTSKMSDQELQFHYFKMHDADNNNKLDGCELIKSLIHWHEQGHHDPNLPVTAGAKLFEDSELTNLIDPILKSDDGNADGYIDYAEFVRAQQKAAAKPGP